MERHHHCWRTSAAAGAPGMMRRRRRRSACLCFLLLLSFLLVFVVVIAVNTSASISGTMIQPSAGHPAAAAVWGINQLMEDLKEQHQQQPLCVGNLLDRRAYEGIGGGDILLRRRRPPGIGNNNDDGIMKHQQHSCRLMSYTAQPIATCLDALFSHQKATANKSSSSGSRPASAVVQPPDELLFVFMGDSRIRQQFFNFVKMIPNYDRVTVPSPIPLKYHGDIEMTSRILRLRVSFKWRPLVNDKLIDTLHHIRETATSDPRKRPQFILLSMAAWHMLREHGADMALYQRRMTQLGPILASMSAHCCRIIWLRQYTSVDSYGDNGKSNTMVVSDKLRHYNQIALSRLVTIQHQQSSDQHHSSNSTNHRSRSGVHLWDSSDPFADEYVRACSIHKRYEHSSYKTKEYATAYANCNDYVHTGYSALSQATQLLFNDLCNAYMM